MTDDGLGLLTPVLHRCVVVLSLHRRASPPSVCEEPLHSWRQRAKSRRNGLGRRSAAWPWGSIVIGYLSALGAVVTLVLHGCGVGIAPTRLPLAATKLSSAGA